LTAHLPTPPLLTLSSLSHLYKHPLFDINLLLVFIGQLCSSELSRWARGMNEDPIDTFSFLFGFYGEGKQCKIILVFRPRKIGGLFWVTNGQTAFQQLIDGSCILQLIASVHTTESLGFHTVATAIKSSWVMTSRKRIPTYRTIVISIWGKGLGCVIV
jgi:hypothetical protein